MGFRPSFPVLAAFLFTMGLGGAAHGQDLTFSSSTAPATGSTAGHGSVFAVSYSVRNIGTVTVTPTFYVYFYYCEQQSAANCTSLGSKKITDDFAPGQTRSYPQNLTVPSAAMYGTGYVRFFVDATKKVSETNEGNNERYDDISVSTRPDLYVSKMTAPYTGSVKSKGSTFKVRPTIYNKTKTSRLTKDFWVRYYYCPTNTTTSACVSLGQELRTTDLNSGKATTFTSMPLTMPSATTNGTRYIRAHVDYNNGVTESDEGNNNYYKAITVNGNPVDLYFTGSLAPATGGTTGHGSAFSVQSTVRNGAAEMANTNFYIYYYYCPTQLFSGCTSLGNTYVKDTFTAGQSRTYSKNLVVPSAALRGTGYIYFWLDATNKVLETNENNNNRFDAISVTTWPDLYVSKATVPYTGSVAGPGPSSPRGPPSTTSPRPAA